MEKRSMYVTRMGITLLSVLLIFGAFTFAGPCAHDDGTVSMCAKAGIAIRAAGIVTCGIALALDLVLLSKRKFALRRALALAIVLCGLFAAFAPGSFLLPTCMMATMRCNAVMVPFARVIGCLIAALGLADAVLCSVQR